MPDMCTWQKENAERAQANQSKLGTHSWSIGARDIGALGLPTPSVGAVGRARGSSGPWPAWGLVFLRSACAEGETRLRIWQQRRAPRSHIGVVHLLLGLALTCTCVLCLTVSRWCVVCKGGGPSGTLACAWRRLCGTISWPHVVPPGAQSQNVGQKNHMSANIFTFLIFLFYIFFAVFFRVSCGQIVGSSSGALIRHA